MRLWTVHPTYLDAKGLVALWREALLAKNVLEEKTKGYKNHPQLQRFKEVEDPVSAIHQYLFEVWKEAKNRNYNFDLTKINTNIKSIQIPVNDGQIAYELEHLLRKLEERDKPKWEVVKKIKRIDLHSMFISRPGDIEPWEILISK